MFVVQNEDDSLTIACYLAMSPFKVEYHTDAEYENPLKNSEKIACVGQRVLYPIMEEE